MLLTCTLQISTIYVQFLNPIFKTESLTFAELALCLTAVSVVWVVVELDKAWRGTFIDTPTDIAVDTP